MSEDVATAERNRLRIFGRSVMDRVYRGMRKVKERGEKRADRPDRGTDAGTIDFGMYPPVSSRERYRDLLERIRWYLPGLEDDSYRLSLPVTPDVRPDEIRPEPPAGLNLTSAPEPSIDPDTDHLLIHRFHPWLLLAPFVLQWLDRTTIVDPTYYSHRESGNYAQLQTMATPDRELDELEARSRRKYERFAAEASRYKKSIVFCTGPSIEQVYDLDVDYSDHLTVVCNSMVKNHDMLDRIQPDVLVFADPVFHFGCSEYARTFRQEMVETVNTFDPQVIIPLERMPLLQAHHPELEPSLIGMPVRSSDEPFQFPTANQFYVRSTNNILTRLMLPVASRFTDQIYFIGSDGRDPDASYFWEHNPEVQFEGLKKTAFETHPSFFRDRDYAAYYRTHCRVLEELLEYGEQQGKTYRTLTPSRIPALQKRSNIANEP